MQQFQVFNTLFAAKAVAGFSGSIIFKSCMCSCGGGRGLATGLCTPQENLPQKHRQDEEKHDPSASVEAEVDAAVSTATFSYSRLGRA